MVKGRSFTTYNNDNPGGTVEMKIAFNDNNVLKAERQGGQGQRMIVFERVGPRVRYSSGTGDVMFLMKED